MTLHTSFDNILLRDILIFRCFLQVKLNFCKGGGPMIDNKIRNYRNGIPIGSNSYTIISRKTFKERLTKNAPNYI